MSNETGHLSAGSGAVSVKTAAKALDLSEYTIRGAISRGELKAKRVGTALRISNTALEEWFESLEDAKESD